MGELTRWVKLCFLVASFWVCRYYGMPILCPPGNLVSYRQSCVSPAFLCQAGAVSRSVAITLYIFLFGRLCGHLDRYSTHAKNDAPSRRIWNWRRPGKDDSEFSAVHPQAWLRRARGVLVPPRSGDPRVLAHSCREATMSADADRRPRHPRLFGGKQADSILQAGKDRTISSSRLQIQCDWIDRKAIS